MKRSGFNRATPERAPVIHRPIPAHLRRSASMSMSSTLVLASPKELVVAKPGKRAPNAEERAWMDAITEIGCIACLIDGHPGNPGAVHHLLRGGQRIGHLHTLCLCDPGHHQNSQQLGLVSRHPWRARFEERYGTEVELLERTRRLVLGEPFERKEIIQ